VRRLFAIIFLISFCAVPVVADSLWAPNQTSLYGVQKRRIRIGDIVTVLISESTSAVQSATTRTQKDAAVGAGMINNWDQVANLLGNETLRKTFDFGLNGDDSFQGTGQTSRQSNVRAVVTCTVTEILESGNLFIVGEHRVKVNNEIETVRISGIIRPQDITGQNTVLSSQVAKAEVSVNGEGVVAAKQTPGIMTKLFNWLF
jgi:flagellar L-ring protein precursor FlgH